MTGAVSSGAGEGTFGTSGITGTTGTTLRRTVFFGSPEVVDGETEVVERTDAAERTDDKLGDFLIDFVVVDFDGTEDGTDNLDKVAFVGVTDALLAMLSRLVRGVVVLTAVAFVRVVRTLETLATEATEFVLLLAA